MQSGFLQAGAMEGGNQLLQMESSLLYMALLEAEG